MRKVVNDARALRLADKFDEAAQKLGELKIEPSSTDLSQWPHHLERLAPERHGRRGDRLAGRARIGGVGGLGKAAGHVVPGLRAHLDEPPVLELRVRLHHGVDADSPVLRQLTDRGDAIAGSVRAALDELGHLGCDALVEQRCGGGRTCADH